MLCGKRRGASQLNFIRVEIRKENVGLEVRFHAFLTLTLVGDEWSAQSPVSTAKRKNSEGRTSETIKVSRPVLMPCREMIAVFVLKNQTHK